MTLQPVIFPYHDGVGSGKARVEAGLATVCYLREAPPEALHGRDIELGDDAMSNMERGITAATKRFPHLAGEIRRRAFADPAFRSLCDDLVEAQDALSRWAVETSTQARLRFAEYRQLVKELSDEIAAELPGGTDRDGDPLEGR